MPFTTNGAEASDSTSGITTTQDDALGRTTLVTTADGAVASTVYNGNATTNAGHAANESTITDQRGNRAPAGLTD